MLLFHIRTASGLQNDNKITPCRHTYERDMTNSHELQISQFKDSICLYLRRFAQFFFISFSLVLISTKQPFVDPIIVQNFHNIMDQFEERTQTSANQLFKMKPELKVLSLIHISEPTRPY